MGAEARGMVLVSAVLTAFGVFQGMRACAQARWGDPTLHGRRIIKTGRRGDAHAALGDLEIKRLVQPGAAVLEQDILAGDAELRRAVLDVSRNVGRAHDEQPQVAAVGAQNELARGIGVIERTYSRRGEQRQRFVENPALREREGDHVVTVRKAWILPQRTQRTRK